MKISINIQYDSYNSDSRDKVEFVGKKDMDVIAVKLGDREITVDKNELVEAINLLWRL